VAALHERLDSALYTETLAALTAVEQRVQRQEEAAELRARGDAAAAQVKAALKDRLRPRTLVA
jgi:hypothetical protein